MFGEVPSEADAAYMAVYVHLAAAALGQDRRKGGGSLCGLGTESVC